MPNTNTFDYIIVGAGSAGCVLANRLTEDPSVRVLLLEAGGADSHMLLKIPIAWTVAAYNPRFGWGYVTEPEPGANNRQIPLPRGKMLGGSSSINAMRYSRGHQLDYDQWRQMGLEGWGFSDILHYFRKSENSWRGANKYHGSGGPLNVVHATAPELFYGELAAASKAAGHAENDDIHGDSGEGLARAELTVSASGRRASTARTFLRLARKRTNLTVVSHALTTRVRIDKGRAVGVDYLQHGASHTAHAEREVILSGGAYNSPQLLMLSGIGPADELRALGITPVLDRPDVGRNLAEHPLVPLIVEVAEPSSLVRHLRMDRAAMMSLRWFFGRGGPFATNGNTAGLFVRTRPELERPDVQLIFGALARDSWLWWPGQSTKHSLQASLSLQHPEALGWVKLRSANPADPPRIFLNLFGAQADVDTMVRGLRVAREVYNTEPLKRIVRGELLPGPQAQSDADLAAHVRESAATTQHPCCTCRMGIDDGAVVDAQLRVRGIDGLRVIDASVMPTIPGGHINATVIAIAEKGADMIKAAAATKARAAAAA